MRKLDAVSLKQALWETLNAIKDNEIEASRGDAIASQAREIIRTSSIQLKIIEKCKADVSEEMKDFAIPKKQSL